MAMALLMESACNVRLIAHIQKLFSMHEELCSLVLRYPSVSLGTGKADVLYLVPIYCALLIYIEQKQMTPRGTSSPAGQSASGSFCSI